MVLLEPNPWNEQTLVTEAHLPGRPHSRGELRSSKASTSQSPENPASLWAWMLSPAGESVEIRPLSTSAARKLKAH